MEILREPMCEEGVEVGDLLTSAVLTRLISSRKKAACALAESCGLTLSAYRCLALLDLRGTATARDIQLFLPCSQSVASSLMTELVSAGAIAVADQQAPREYQMTEAGCKLVCAGDDAVEEAIRGAYQDVAADLYQTNVMGALLNMAPLARVRMRNRRYFPEYSLLECALFSEKRCVKVSREQGLSFMEFRVLFLLFEHGRGLQMKLIEEELDVSPAFLTEVCVALEGRGLISKESLPLDKRSRIVWLTSEGSVAVESSIKPLTTALYEVTAGRLTGQEKGVAKALALS